MTFNVQITQHESMKHRYNNKKWDKTFHITNKPIVILCRLLTLWRPLLPYRYGYKASSCARPG